MHRYLERGEAAPELIQGSVRPRFHYGNPALEFPTIDPTAAESGAEARPSFPCMFFPSREVRQRLVLSTIHRVRAAHSDRHMY